MFGKQKPLLEPIVEISQLILKFETAKKKKKEKLENQLISLIKTLDPNELKKLENNPTNLLIISKIVELAPAEKKAALLNASLDNHRLAMTYKQELFNKTISHLTLQQKAAALKKLTDTQRIEINLYYSAIIQLALLERAKELTTRIAESAKAGPLNKEAVNAAIASYTKQVQSFAHSRTEIVIAMNAVVSSLTRLDWAIQQDKPLDTIIHDLNKEMDLKITDLTRHYFSSDFKGREHIGAAENRHEETAALYDRLKASDVSQQDYDKAYSRFQQLQQEQGFHQLVMRTANPLAAFAEIQKKLDQIDIALKPMVEEYGDIVLKHKGEGTLDNMRDSKGQNRPKKNIVQYRYYTNPDLIDGISQHQSNPSIFFSVSPIIGYSDRPLPGRTITPGNFFADEEYARGAEFLKDTIKKIGATPKGKDKPITYIVLGSAEVKENMEIYNKLEAIPNPQPDSHHIEEYTLQKEKTGAAHDGKIYYLNAHRHEFDLTSYDLETLYHIYATTSAAENPLVVHCQQGLDRTSNIIMSFELLRRYDEVFHGSPTDIAKKINELVNEIRDSRSPQAFTKPTDIQQSIRFAQALKAIDMQKRVEYALAEYIAKQPNTKAGNKIKDALGEINKAFAKPLSLKEKAEYVDKFSLTDLNLDKQGIMIVNALKVAMHNRLEAENALQAKISPQKVAEKKISKEAPKKAETQDANEAPKEAPKKADNEATIEEAARIIAKDTSKEAPKKADKELAGETIENPTTAKDQVKEKAKDKTEETALGPEEISAQNTDEWHAVHKKETTVQDLLRSATRPDLNVVTGPTFKNLASGKIAIGTKQAADMADHLTTTQDEYAPDQLSNRDNISKNTKKIKELFDAILNNKNVEFEIKTAKNGEQYMVAKYNNKNYNLSVLMKNADWEELKLTPDALQKYEDYIYSRNNNKIYYKPGLPKRIDPKTGLTDQENPTAIPFHLKISKSDQIPTNEIFQNSPAKHNHELIICDNRIFYINYVDKKMTELNANEEMIKKLETYHGRILSQTETSKINEIIAITGHQQIFDDMKHYLEAWYREQIRNFKQAYPESKLDELTFAEISALNITTGDFHKTGNMFMRGDPRLLNTKSFPDNLGNQYPNRIVSDPSNAIREHFITSIVAMHGMNKCKERKKYTYRFDEYTPELYQSKMDQYNMILMHIDPSKKINLRALKKASRNNGDLPILIKQGDVISIYGICNGQWKVTQLDSQVFASVTFPDISKTSILTSDSIPKEVFEEIKYHNAHRKVFNERSLVSTAYTESSYITEEKLVKTQEGKFSALTLYENAEGAVLTPLSQTQHENEFALKPGDVVYEEMNTIDGVRVVKAKQASSIAKEEKLKQMSAAIREFRSEKYKDIITPIEIKKLDEFRLRIAQYNTGQTSEFNELYKDFLQFKKEVHVREVALRQPSTLPKESKPRQGIKRTLPRKHLTRRKAKTNLRSEAANPTTQTGESLTPEMPKKIPPRPTEKPPTIQPESILRSDYLTQIDKANLQKITLQLLEGELTPYLSPENKQWISNLNLESFSSNTSPDLNKLLSIYDAAYAEKYPDFDIQLAKRKRVLKEKIPDLSRTSEEKQYQNNLKSWNSFLNHDSKKQFEQSSQSPAPDYKKRQEVMLRLFALYDYLGLNMEDASHGGRVRISCDDIDALFKAIDPEGIFEKRLVSSHSIGRTSSGELYEKQLEGGAAAIKYASSYASALGKHYGMNIGVCADGKAAPADGSFGHAYAYVDSNLNALLFGIEGAESGHDTQFGDKHGAAAKKNPLSATGGTKWGYHAILMSEKIPDTINPGTIVLLHDPRQHQFTAYWSYNGKTFNHTFSENDLELRHFKKLPQGNEQSDDRELIKKITSICKCQRQGGHRHEAFIHITDLNEAINHINNHANLEEHNKRYAGDLTSENVRLKQIEEKNRVSGKVKYEGQSLKKEVRTDKPLTDTEEQKRRQQEQEHFNLANEAARTVESLSKRPILAATRTATASPTDKKPEEGVPSLAKSVVPSSTNQENLQALLLTLSQMSAMLNTLQKQMAELNNTLDAAARSTAQKQLESHIPPDKAVHKTGMFAHPEYAKAKVNPTLAHSEGESEGEGKKYHGSERH